MIEERQPLRAHKISLSNRSLGVITGVKDIDSFLYSNIEEPGKKEGLLGRLLK